MCLLHHLVQIRDVDRTQYRTKRNPATKGSRLQQKIHLVHAAVLQHMLPCMINNEMCYCIHAGLKRIDEYMYIYMHTTVTFTIVHRTEILRSL